MMLYDAVSALNDEGLPTIEPLRLAFDPANVVALWVEVPQKDAAAPPGIIIRVQTSEHMLENFRVTPAHQVKDLGAWYVQAFALLLERINKCRLP